MSAAPPAPPFVSGGIRVALGLGCDRGTPAATLAEAVDGALAAARQVVLTGADAMTPSQARLQVVAVASIDLKADEPGLLELARSRGWSIVFHPAARLAAVPVPNPSETVRRHTGTPSVAEAAALLAAGGVESASPAAATALLVEKYKLRGPDGRHATVSVARILSA